VTSAAKKILEEALALSPQEREELVTALSSSLEPVQLSPKWSVEIGDRIRRITRGDAKFLDAAEHLAQLRQKHTEAANSPRGGRGARRCGGLHLERGCPGYALVFWRPAKRNSGS
jgi:hypothetical protein